VLLFGIMPFVFIGIELFFGIGLFAALLLSDSFLGTVF